MYKFRPNGLGVRRCAVADQVFSDFQKNSLEVHELFAMRPLT